MGKVEFRAYQRFDDAIAIRLQDGAPLNAEDCLLSLHALVLPERQEESSRVVRAAIRHASLRAAAAAGRYSPDIKDWKFLHEAADAGSADLTKFLKAIDHQLAPDPLDLPRQEAVSRVALLLQQGNSSEDPEMAFQDAIALLRSLEALRRLSSNLERRRELLAKVFPYDQPKSRERAALNAFALPLAEAWIFLTGAPPGKSRLYEHNPFLRFLVAACQDWQPARAADFSNMPLRDVLGATLATLDADGGRAAPSWLGSF